MVHGHPTGLFQAGVFVRGCWLAKLTRQSEGGDRSMGSPELMPLGLPIARGSSTTTGLPVDVLRVKYVVVIRLVVTVVDVVAGGSVVVVLSKPRYSLHVRSSPATHVCSALE